MKINKIVLALLCPLFLGSPIKAYGSSATKEETKPHAPVVASILEGEDTEAKVADAIARFLGDTLEPDLSDFESLTGRGLHHLGHFERARGLFVELTEARNGMCEASTLMFTEFSSNEPAKANSYIQPIKLTRPASIHEEDYLSFNRKMTWSTLCLKFKSIVGYKILHENLQGAYDKHIELKAASFHREYKDTARKLVPLQTSYGKINALYPDMPDAIEKPDVSAMDLEDLKDTVPQFKEAVEAYKSGLTAAKKWQSSFTALHKKHAGYVTELGKINTGFEKLRETNRDNPEIPEGHLDELDPIKDIGNLEDIRTVLEAIEDQIKEYRSQLAKARKWKPEVPAVGVEEKAEEKE